MGRFEARLTECLKIALRSFAQALLIGCGGERTEERGYAAGIVVNVKVGDCDQRGLGTSGTECRRGCG